MTEAELSDKLKQAQDLEQRGDYFSAAFYYKDALRLARNLGDSENIKLCKSKLLEMNQKSQSSFQSLSVEQKIPTEGFDQFTDKLMTYELEQILYVVGVHPNFCAKAEEVKKSANKTMPISYQIASLSTISADGHLVRGGDDPQHHWYCQMYQIHQDIITNVVLARLFFKLKENGRLTKESLLNYLASVQIANQEQLKILDVAFERYFTGDYVSAMHILIPQFESFFLAASEKVGIDTISLNQTKEISTQPKMLGLEQMDKLEFQDFWGKDLCEQIKFILFEPLGYKLRHKIAHGEIRSGECNFHTVSLVIYLFLAVSSRRVKYLVESEAKKD